MKDIIESAMRVLAGATVLDRVDGQTEIVSSGTVHTIDTWRFHQKIVPMVREARAGFMLPRGYQPPLDAEALIAIRNFLETAFELAMLNETHPRVKVLFLLHSQSGCSYWRCEEPARIINEQFRDTMYVDVTTEIDFNVCMHYDVIVVQRGLFLGVQAAVVQSVLEKLKRAGKKIVYEIDDDLKNLSLTNSVKYVLDPMAAGLVQWLHVHSNAVFCSTETLRDVLGLANKTYVLENSLDFSRYSLPERTPEREEILHISWHGGESHQVDLDWLADPLHEFLVNKKWKIEKETKKRIIFSAFGYFPDQLDQYISRTANGKLVDMHLVKDPGLSRYLADNFPGQNMRFSIKGRHDVRYVHAVDYTVFHQKLIDLEPDICVCPLNPTLPFNASKSNIKFVESTLAGAACVVTEMSAELHGRALKGPFDDIPDDCVIKVKTAAEMITAVRELLVNADLRRSLVEAASIYVRERYDLQKNARLWAEALCEVAGRGREFLGGVNEATEIEAEPAKHAESEAV